jgi:hypothetical protein
VSGVVTVKVGDRIMARFEMDYVEARVSDVVAAHLPSGYLSWMTDDGWCFGQAPLSMEGSAWYREDANGRRIR